MQDAIAGKTGPIYARIDAHLREQIERGVYAPGAFLPPEDELAREAKVSVGTIKKALSQLAADGWIERTRGRGTQVLARPANGTARKPVLVLLGSIKRLFFADIFEGVRAELMRAGCQPILHDNEYSEETERELLEEFGLTVAGAIIAPFVGIGVNHAAFGALLDAHLPLVFVDRYLARLNVDAVVSDNVKGGYLATRHLIELGHRRIAVMPRINPVVSVSDRIEGYRQALVEAGLPFEPRLVAPAGDGGYDAVYETTPQVLAQHPDVTAIFVPRDDAAWGCIQRLADMGVRVPADISVVGFGDDPGVCDRIRPRLTTVRQDNRSLGVAAATLLIERMRATGRLPRTAQGEPAPPAGAATATARIMALPVELIVRNSTAAPASPRRPPAAKKATVPAQVRLH